jgi:PAS domain S-box-containing protein
MDDNEKTKNQLIQELEELRRRIAELEKSETDRMQTERHQQLMAEILGILNDSPALNDAVNRILTAIKRETEFDAVGIRLRSGEDFPYFVQKGFSDDFLLTENTLVVRDHDGWPCREKNGNYRLECTCGLVVSGQTDPANPLFTPGGSAWTNNSLTLLDLQPDQDPRLHPRNRCVHAGFLSVALIPIRENQEVIGLLQLNDRRKDCFTLDMIHFFEGISSSIGVALKRKQAEEDLKKANKVTNNILNSISDAFFSLDDNLTVTFFNPAAERLLGRKSEEVLGCNLFDAFPEARGSIFEDRYRQAIRTKCFISFETYFDIEPYRNWYEVRAYPQENGISVFFQVTTERKQAEEALLESEKRLRWLNEHILNMVMVLSHDVRGPLISVVSILKLLLRGAYGKLDQNLSNTIEDLLSRCVRLLGTTEDYLGKASIVDGSITIEREVLDLRQDIIDPVLDELADDLTKHEIGIDNRLRSIPAGSIAISANKTWLKAVYRNLFTNAIKYGGKGCTISFGYEAYESHYRLNVYNSGNPIPEPDRQRLFVRFGRIETEGKPSQDGVGLGLSLCQKIILDHGGEIWYEALPNGSNFIFTISREEAVKR